VEIIRGRPAGVPSAQRTETFTGVVYADPVRSGSDVTVANIVFTPCSRTFWHYHEGGQILHVVAGSGWVCAEGGEPQGLGAGDVVWTPPGERHWHGGTPETYMTHMAISLGATVWLGEVSDAEYGAAS
jgi:quercetin dioxygenase-like cupin family protein